MMRLTSIVIGMLCAGSVCVINSPVAQSDPLTPPSPTELAFLDQVRRLLPIAGDDTAFNGDGEQLEEGRHACFMRDVNGIVGSSATGVSPVITQLAFIYLCPR